MCGIIGGRKDQIDKKGGIKKFLTLLNHRGTDSFGIMYQQGGIWKLHKEMKLKQFVKFWNSTVPLNANCIVHNRATSVGGTTLPLAHPITKGNTSVIHNGTSKILCEMALGATSDTEGMCMYLDASDSVPEMFGLFPNKLGIVFTVKSNKLYFYRDDIRPLTYHKETGIFASEPLFNGEWYDIKEHNGTLENFEKFPLGESKELINSPIWVEDYCMCCKKTHLTNQNANVCNICEVRGETYTYKGGYWEEYYGVNRNNLTPTIPLPKEMENLQNYCSNSLASILNLKNPELIYGVLCVSQSGELIVKATGDLNDTLYYAYKYPYKLVGLEVLSEQSPDTLMDFTLMGEEYIDLVNIVFTQSIYSGAIKTKKGYIISSFEGGE